MTVHTVQVSRPDGTRYVVNTWGPMGQGDTAKGAAVGVLADKTVHVHGNFSGAASVAIVGSMDNSTWFTLNDIAGDPLTFSAAGAKVLLENPLYVKPGDIADGDGSTAITVSIGASERV